MSRSNSQTAKPVNEVVELRARVAVAEETLAAIRNGEVDALVVASAGGDQIFTIKGAERPYRLLMEAMNEGAATVLPDGTILYCNRRLAHMAGRELDRMMGTSLIDLISASQRQYLRTWLKTVPSDGFKAEFDFCCGDNETTVPVQFSLSQLEVDNVATVAVVATELTERKQYERMLLAQNEELERRVAERTRDLKDANARLQKAEAQLRLKAQDLEDEVAERTSELRESVGSLEQFCYTIAHDLRAPLRTMHGFSDALLNECALDETAQDYARRIAAAASRMDLLIRDLLAYGRMNSADLEAFPVNPAGLLEDVTRSFGCDDAVFQIEKPMPRVQANPTGLKQVFENLIANARKFVAPGVNPKVHFFAEQRGGLVRICIKDNGIGIDERFHQRIFRVFERLNPTLYPGTGIGLAIVQKGVERMGGRVGIESQPGHGSCFWIELPKA
jgi:PAS domain S-box-containing protein